MSGMLDYVAEAIRLLRDQADAVHESHNAPGETTFEGEPEAEAAYAELERVANGLETEAAARLRGDGEQNADTRTNQRWIERAEAKLSEQGQAVACTECGAKSQAEAEVMCIGGGEKDDCHGNELWPDDDHRPQTVAVAGDVQARAREILAAQYERTGAPSTARAVREGALSPVERGDIIPALVAALSAPSEQVAASVAVPQGWRPITEAPAGRLCVVAWNDHDDPDNPERHDFDYIDDGRWMRHDENVEYAESVAPPGSKIPQHDAPYQWFIELPSMPAAAPVAPEREG